MQFVDVLTYPEIYEVQKANEWVKYLHYEIKGDNIKAKAGNKHLMDWCLSPAITQSTGRLKFLLRRTLKVCPPLLYALSHLGKARIINIQLAIII